MTSYTAREVQSAIRNAAEGWGYSEYGIEEGRYWAEIGREEVIDGIDGTVHNVLTEGGEGQGDQYVVVIKVVPVDGEEQFFRINGYYSSYDGVNFEFAELFEVAPREKTIITYEAI